MAANDQNTGSLFEGLISDEADAKNLVTAFSNNRVQIISPTVSGLLDGFEGNSLGISGCNISFDTEIVIDSNGNASGSGLGDFVDNKESESSKDPSFTNSLLSFVEKVKEIRSSYLPYSLYNGLTLNLDSNNISEKESFENAFMRMLGMPDDIDVGTNGISVASDDAIKITYATASATKDVTSNGGSSGGFGLMVKVATLGEITGRSPPANDKFANIIEERQKLPSSSSGYGRYFDFGNISITSLGDQKSKQEAEEQALLLSQNSTTDGDQTTTPTEENRALNYYDPRNLFRFYYLKSVPIQSSEIYGCVSEPEKIVAKPFDYSALSKVNGIKTKTSLLETIIRIRLDRITGDPGIYSTTTNENDTTGTDPITTVSAKNVGDKITQVECFLLQKLKKVLFEIANKYRDDIKKLHEDQLREDEEKGNSPPPPVTPPASATPPDPDTKLHHELQNLEILKAREDAILFLLKDTSSSSDSKNYETLYSSLDLQQGTIRTASGFEDALSGPLYSILSQRSEYLEKKIRELSDIIDKSGEKKIDVNSDHNGLQRNSEGGNPEKYSYIGVCSEDFIVYAMALLSLNQDYLIGLLPQNNRVNLANTISNSILSSKKDPYGIIARVNKSPKDGGFPTVADSVNALSLLVCKFYGLYIYYASKGDSPVEQIASTLAYTRDNGIV